jgi:superfamily II DNA or RNA helicase
VAFQPGDRVRRSASGDEGVVVGLSGDFCEVVLPAGRVLVHAEELELLPSDPAERLAAGEVGRGVPYTLRLQALFLRHAYRYDPLSGLSNARIEPALHQVYLAHLVAQKLQPRMILADEVGLGKTIEAGLVIKELRARGLIERVLIVVPASLQLQWQQELRSKFNEDFEVIDGAAIKFLGRDGTNPWTKRPNVICSLPLAANPNRVEKIVEAEWDMVVFDEAHRVRRWLQSKNKIKTTQAYRLADELKELANGFLLLTATPMQLHPYELYSLIELVEPGLYPAFEVYEGRRRDLPRLNDLMRALKSWGAMSMEERTSIVRRHASLIRELGVGEDDSVSAVDDHELSEALMDGLVKRHPLAGVLVRNRKAEVGGFTRREAQRYLVTLSAEESQVYSDVTDYIRYIYNRARGARNMTAGFVMVTYQKMLTSSSHAIRQSLRRRAEKLRAELTAQQEAREKVGTTRLEELRDAEEPSSALQEIDSTVVDEEGIEWEIQAIDELVERLGKVRDSKAAELLKVLRVIFDRYQDEKVLVFTQFIETQEFLAGVLEQQGFNVTVFNGRMKLEEKEASVGRFRRDAQILISTEAGGEGRNFQFCHVMVNYDLPWNPMKVEQRIGRLDRIGQKKPVFVYNLACGGTIEERVLQVLDDRIGLFEESVGSLDPILGEVERDIEQLVMAQVEQFDEAFEQYEVQLEQRVREAREQERVLADFVLDRASLRRDVADQLLGRAALARFPDLQRFVAEALDFFGGHLSEHEEGGHVISLSPQLATRLRRRESVVRGVFDWSLALKLEELDFFAFGHELIDRIVDLPMHVEPVVTGARRLDGDPPGLWVEVIYEISVEGVKPWGTMHRHLVNEGLEVRSNQLDSLPQSGESLDDFGSPDWVPKAVAASKREFETELAAARGRVREEDEAVKAEELGRAERIFEYRRIRLEKLIDDQASWIREKEQTGTDRERKILPARRGKLAKDRERLERLRFEYELQVEDIRKREAGVAATVLAAGLVLGE